MEHRRCFLNRDGETPESACSEDVKELDGRIEGNQCCFVQLLAKQHFHSAVIFFFFLQRMHEPSFAVPRQIETKARHGETISHLPSQNTHPASSSRVKTEQKGRALAMECCLFSQQHLQPFIHPGVLGLC